MAQVSIVIQRQNSFCLDGVVWKKPIVQAVLCGSYNLRKQVTFVLVMYLLIYLVYLRPKLVIKEIMVK